ncbi:MAG: TVP38/TMEM64 family protein [Vicinamibacterales bacterium]|jgi:uncharacterized membrane protein YdjX (TVP38/TMEM64 family)|nr:hypothetical protein [Acidobacteriota bacterium]MDP7295182.1 TVP38/TMEM64 family protein [Vicinamibacterales bacterium]MDP7670873.1 TVP38/TMEM64 family protein [Vicinamibacterales bacterium]HJO39618.1 TVP38/TMEM64 family protein [Vicinamibacterales bacterium]|tara:strand:- start:1269 stop:1997 length:729 start_codon:yes stop_codon:yes gene_type:complete
MSDTVAAKAHAGGRRWLRLLAGAVTLVALIVVGRLLGGYLPDFVAWVEGLGVWGPVAFVAGYAAATVAFIPGSLLTLTAGAIFGLARGTALVLLGATIGAAAAFLVSRYFARSAIEGRVARHPRFAAIDRAVGAKGFEIVLLLRLSPIFPFNLLNYALGLTRVGFRDYVLASVGMLPGSLLYTYYGKLAGDVAILAGGQPVERGPGYYVILILGLAATVVVTTLVTRTAARALRQATGEESA